MLSLAVTIWISNINDDVYSTNRWLFSTYLNRKI